MIEVDPLLKRDRPVIRYHCVVRRSILAMATG